MDSTAAKASSDQTGGASQPAGQTSSGTSQSAGDTARVLELTARSAPVIKLDVAVYHPNIHQYEWSDAKSGHTKTNKAFQTLFVDRQDPSQYLSGTQKMKNGIDQPLKELMKKLKDGLSFKLSKISLENTKQEYISTSKKVVINLANTKLDPVLQSSNESPTPQPALTVASCLGFLKNQRFDLIALVTSVSDARPAGPLRHVVDVRLVDGSVDANGKLAELKASLFYNNPLKDHDPMKDLRSHAKGAQAFFFFSLQAKEVTGGTAVENTKDFFFDMSKGAKADELAREAVALHSKPQDQRRVIENEFVPGGDTTDYSTVLGTETFTCLLNSMNSETGVTHIDSEKTVWQINWCEVTWPNSEEVCTKDGKRIWFKTSVLDLCGQMSVWVDEKTALSLSQLSSKEEFLTACREGDPKFPPLSSIKVLRNPKNKDGLAADTAWLRIVDGSDQNLQQAPTQVTTLLLPMMRACEDSSAGIQVAPMAKIRQSSQYALAVSLNDPDSGEPILVPCQKVVSLVTCTQKTSPTRLGDGYKMVTRGVQDASFQSSDASQLAVGFELTAICTMENLASYRLDPPRGGPRYAIVTIVECTTDGFIVESVQLIATADEAKSASESMSRLQYLAVQLAKAGLKRPLPWTNESSPALAKKCRTLGKSPTGPELPNV